MTAAQLTAYLAERGIEAPSLDRLGERLYNGKDVLAVLED
jgi:hypothetical protein